MKKGRIGLAVVALIAFAGIAAGCDEVSAKSDETVCVFDGHGSQKLKYQIFPGEDKRKVGRDDEVVRIPTSFRFYAAFEDRSIADAGAPSDYIGYAQGNTPVKVQGSFKFRFLAENACEWYAKHGRRNARGGDLGFNARNSESASSLSPWVRWLNENFGAVATQTIKSSTLQYTWPELVYGNDPQAPNRIDPVDISYGKHIGKEFTQRLNAALGGRFFCGTDASIWGPDVDESCPPIFFETGPIHTQVQALETEREKTEALRAELENETTQANIRKQRESAQIKDQNLQQRVLQEEVETARLNALKDAEVQKCIILARAGLDCEGHFPTKIVSGTSSR